MEFLLFVGKAVSPIGTVLLDVDFSKRPLNETSIVDTNGHVFTKQGAGVARVIADVEKGNVMDFQNSCYFTTPMVNDLKLSNINFTLRIVYKSTTTAENIIFSTGDYYTVGALVGGFMITLNNNTGSQLFATDSVGNFTRCQYTHVHNTWEDISFTWNPITKVMTVKNNITNSSFPYSIPYGFGDGNLLAIGASYVRGVGVNNYIGQVSRILITTP